MDSNSDSDSSVHSTDAAAFRSSSTILIFSNPNDPQYSKLVGITGYDWGSNSMILNNLAVVATAR